MGKRLHLLSPWAGLWLAVAVMPLCSTPSTGQPQPVHPPLPTDELPVRRQHKFHDKLPEKSSVPPRFEVPAGALGYSAPGTFYLGRHNSLVSLDFVDENRLLFTFQVRGLMNRKVEESSGIDKRQVRAVVVTLPDGKVEAEAQWTLHGRARYLWMLNDGHFLLRDLDKIEEGDSKLQLKPILHFPGRLLWLELDPALRLIDTNFIQPAAPRKASNVEQSSATAKDENTNGLNLDVVVRTLNRESGQTVLENKVPLTVPSPISPDGYQEAETAMLAGMFRHLQLPINSVAYLQALREKENSDLWRLNLKHFSGGSKELGRLQSKCLPTADFISEHEFVVTACTPKGGWHLVAMTTGGRRLWDVEASTHEIWPVITRSPDGSRFARQTVFLNHSVEDTSRPLKAEAVNGQMLKIYDAADGKVALEAPVSPTFDAGGNVAISPSGRRVALLNGTAIQVFELPAPASLPVPGH